MSIANDWKKLRQHEVVLCDQQGDTLVIAPQGDVQEFASNSFEEELARIRRVVAEGAVSNIVCDFSATSYFSQGVVIPLIGLRDQVRTRGRFVVSGLSDEMSKMFEHSESGTHLLQYPTRNDAVRDIATVSWSTTLKTRLRQNHRLLIGAGAAFTIILVSFAWVSFGERLVVGSRAQQLYFEFVSVWDDARDVVQSNPTKANWNGLGNRIYDAIYAGVLEIRQSDSATAADLAVAEAANQLQMISQDPRSRLESMQDRFLDLAANARTAIKVEDDVTLPTLEPIEFRSVE